MGGLGAVIFVGLYVAVWWWIARRFKPWWAKVPVALVALAIAFGDELLGQIELKRLCAEKGGYHVYRRIEDVEGFVDSFAPPSKEWITKGGYRFVEGIQQDRIFRAERAPDGTVHEATVSEVKGRYELQVNRHGELKSGFQWGEDRIVDRASAEVLASSFNIYYKGGWLLRFLAYFTDAGPGSSLSGSCMQRADHPGILTMTLDVLRPLK